MKPMLITFPSLLPSPPLYYLLILTFSSPPVTYLHVLILTSTLPPSLIPPTFLRTSTSSSPHRPFLPTLLPPYCLPSPHPPSTFTTSVPRSFQIPLHTFL